MDELQRIIDPSNCQYISEVKGRRETFYSKVQFYGVWSDEESHEASRDIKWR